MVGTTKLERARLYSVVSQLLRADPKKNSSWIGREAGVSHTTVRRIRAELEAREELPRQDKVNDPRGRKRSLHYQLPDQSSLPKHSKPAIAVRELNKKLGPLVRALKAECNKHPAQIVIYDVKALAIRIQKQLIEWTDRPSRRREQTSDGHQHAPKMETKL